MTLARLAHLHAQTVGNVRWPTSVFVGHEINEQIPSSLTHIIQRAGVGSLNSMGQEEGDWEAFQKMAADAPCAALSGLLAKWLPNSQADVLESWGYFAELTEQISQAMYRHRSDEACLIMSRAIRDDVFSDDAVSSLVKGNEMYLDRVIAHSARPDVFAAWLEEVSERLVRGGHFDTVSFMLHHLSVEYMDERKRQNFLPLVQGWAHEIRQSLAAAYALQIRETPTLSELAQKKWAATLSSYDLAFANSEMVRNAPSATGLGHAEAASFLHRQANDFWQNSTLEKSSEELATTPLGYQHASEEQLDDLLKW